MINKANNYSIDLLENKLKDLRITFSNGIKANKNFYELKRCRRQMNEVQKAIETIKNFFGK